jgi:hypothetical protein
LHERKYDTHHKPRVKEQEDWCGKDHHHETPAAYSTSKADPLSEPRMLDGYSRALQQEVECGEAIASASGERDHQIVNQTRNHKYQEAGRARAQPSMQRPKNQLMRKLTET